jgi:phosphatidylinositol alpha-1,6-mannosyltransferase
MKVNGTAMLTEENAEAETSPGPACTSDAGRVMLLTEIFPPRHGGSGRWFWETYRRLAPSSCIIAAGHCDGDGAFDSRNELPVHRIDLQFPDTGILSCSGLRSYWRVVRELQSMHRRTPIGMLHCGRCITEGWVGWLLRRRIGVPYLCYVHGEDVNLEPGPHACGVMSSRQHRWMARRVLRDASLLIANSENSHRILETKWRVSPSRIRVVHPGVDTARFVPVPQDESLREKFGWSGRLVVLTVGRLQQRKGHDMLIRALPAIRARHPQILYAIVGNGEELRQLQRLVGDLALADCVQFRPSVTDEELVGLYQQCDLFALPNRAIGSDVEGFGMVLLEAQACGKPVIAGRSGGTAEAMSLTSGRLVSCEGGPELADAVAQLLDQPAVRDEMGLAARQWVCERFAWEAVVERMRSAFADAEAAAQR